MQREHGGDVVEEFRDGLASRLVSLSVSADLLEDIAAKLQKRKRVWANLRKTQDKVGRTLFDAFPEPPVRKTGDGELLRYVNEAAPISYRVRAVYHTSERMAKEDCEDFPGNLAWAM